jgi:antitoxin component YwqK of YwqJK toxin-antitoxin module
MRITETPQRFATLRIPSILMFRFRVFLTTALISLAVSVAAQDDTTEVACDTTFHSMRYTRCVKLGPDRVIAWGNRNEQGQRHGWWRELRKNGKPKEVTEYINGHKIRERWRRGCLWRYDDQGNIISKGKADRRAKPVF